MYCHQVSESREQVYHGHLPMSKIDTLLFIVHIEVLIEGVSISSVWKSVPDWISIYLPCSVLMTLSMLCTSYFTWRVLALYMMYPNLNGLGEDFNLALQTWDLVLKTLISSWKCLQK